MTQNPRGGVRMANTNRSSRGRNSRLAIEHLETRTLLAVTAGFVGGYLHVHGVNLPNSIAITGLGGIVTVFEFVGGAGTSITITGAPVPLPTASVNRIFAEGNDGNDIINAVGVSAALRFPAALSGNIELSGNLDNDVIGGSRMRDCIYGAGGDDFLNGNDGNDMIYGGPGDDHLWGEDFFFLSSVTSSNDSLAGEEGNDSLDGQTGNDLLAGDNVDGAWVHRRAH